MSKVNQKQYIHESKATDYKDYKPVKDRLNNDFNSRFMHYVLGIGSESGELLDAAKKTFIYGKEVDKVNILEEVGDILWYSARLLELIGHDFEDAMGVNLVKLKARYGEKFSEHSALNRDLEKERKILEAEKDK